MPRTSNTIVFFGTDSFSAVSLTRLINEGFTIAAVVTKPDSRKGRGRALSSSLVKEIAHAHAIPVWQPTKLADIAADIAQLDTPTGVLVSFGKIIPQSIIDLFTPGIINVHPSLLPRYRGPSPIETAILQGDSETGVTIMQLSAAMDAGPIYSQLTVPLRGTETAPELEADLAERGAAQLCALLPSIIDGSLQPTPQDDAQARYCTLLSKENSLLQPEQVSAAHAERQVRAYLTFPKTKVCIAPYTLVVTRAHVTTQPESALDIRCSDGAYLAIDELIGPSGKRMSRSAFLNGYGATLHGSQA